MGTASAPRSDTLALVLAGGRGERLYPLTRDRAKGAVPFAGGYRLIDFTLSNCLHSGVAQIFVLPQYRYASLERHLREGWNVFRPERGEALALLPPQQRVGEAWYGGTADAVHQNLLSVRAEGPAHVLILSSDHVYRMDYGPFVERHRQTEAALTIGTFPVPVRDARCFGVLEADALGRVRAFVEKPVRPAPMPGDRDRALVSAGIYVFEAGALDAVLEEDAARPGSSRDFGRDVLPTMVAEGYPVFAYDIRRADPAGSIPDAYWRDIGYVDGYWHASLELLARPPAFDLHDRRWPVHTHHPARPPAHVYGGAVRDSMLCGGVTIRDATVTRSILSPWVTVEPGAQVVESILLDGVRVGCGARVWRAIVDKSAILPASCTVGGNPDLDRLRFHVTPGGVTVVPRGARAEATGASGERAVIGADDPARAALVG